MSCLMSDYSKMDPEEARRVFQERLKQYESIYEPVDEELDKDIPYIKLYNVLNERFVWFICSRSDNISKRIVATAFWSPT